VAVRTAVRRAVLATSSGRGRLMARGEPRPERRSLRGLLVRLVAALAVVLLLLIGVAAVGTVVTAKAYSDAGEQALARLGASNQLLIDMLNADTGSRGYVLTGRGDYLEPYTTAVDRYPEDLDRLRYLVRDDPKLAADVERANNNAQLWFADIIHLVQIRRERHVAAAIALVNQGLAQQWLNAFRAASTQLAADVQISKQQSFDAAKTRRNITLVGIIAAALLAFAVVALTARRLWRRVGIPIDLLALGVGRVARGRFLDPVPASDSAVRELGELVDGFNTMQRQVFQQRDAVAAAARREAGQRTERRLWETVQQGLLPAGLPGYLGYRLVARYRPAERALLIGGDFYDAEVLADGRLAMIVGDMAGHGAGAAAQAAGLRFGWRTMTAVDPDPKRVLTALNTQMSRPEVRKAGLFATVIYALVDPDGNGVFASAGHPAPLVLGEDHCTELEPVGSGPLLGGMDDAEWPTTTFSLGRGETLLLFTDGLLEAGASDDQFGIDRVREVLRRERTTAVEARLERLIEAARRHDAGSLRDDVVVVALERVAVPPVAV
jgi:serine phosphatase RsbU (regulator of sigma subunit)/CHASE3 domain sensor protein